MINVENVDEIRQLQDDLNTVFNNETGKRVMDFLEEISGQSLPIFDPSNINITLVNEGKRQIVLTIKTLLRLKPTQVVEYFRRLQ